MKVVKVYFNHDENDYLITRINGSHEAIADYYMMNWFNCGTESDCMKQCTKVEFLEEC